LVAGAAMALALRRQLPVPAYAGSLACAGAYLLIGDPPGPILLAPFLGLVALLGAKRSLPIWITSAVGGAALLSAVHGAVNGWSWPVAVFAGIWLCLAAAAGVALDARRGYLRGSQTPTAGPRRGFQRSLRWRRRCATLDFAST